MQDAVLILGASGRIGSAIARELTRDGYSPVLHGLGATDRLRKLGKELSAPIVTGDLSDSAEVKQLFNDVGNLADLLSGVIFAIAKPFPHKLSYRTDWEIYQDQMDSQLKALHLVVNKALPYLKGSVNGARLIVLSTEYVLGVPPIKIAPYVAAKAALTAYSRVIAQELLRHNIRVHILAPGMVRSQLTADMPGEYLDSIEQAMPEKVLTSGEDVAKVAAFLMQSAADTLYGTVVPVSRATRR